MFNDINKILLVTDLDGTLLPNNKILSEQDLNAIKKLTDAGGKFTIATGRAIQSANGYAELLSLQQPAILYNGGVIYDFDRSKALWKYELPFSSRKIVTDVLNNFDDVGIEILTEDIIYVAKMNEFEEHHIKIANTNPIECDISKINDGWIKILFALSPEKMDEFSKFIESRNYPGCDFVISSPMFFEVVPKDVSKGTALNVLKDKFGFLGHTVVAVGDYDNDITMLKNADVGFATANAKQNVKDISDIVLDKTCDENAIAKVVQYIFDRVNN